MHSRMHAAAARRASSVVGRQSSARNSSSICEPCSLRSPKLFGGTKGPSCAALLLAMNASGGSGRPRR
eukprot:7821301-Pyramimonas_sp.AAC.1